MTVTIPGVTVGVLALQGAFSEHILLLQQAAEALKSIQSRDVKWKFLEVRTPKELDVCDALIVPGGESTTISLIAARSGLLEPLRDFVK
jgi:5'-phosphate synthase pdxT subunit